MYLLRTAAAAAVLLAAALPARAQDAASADTAAADTTPRTAVRKGVWSLSFDVPAYGSSSGSAAFGVWEMVGARTNLGLTFAVNVYGRDRESGSSGQTEATTYLEAGVEAKRYVALRGPVAPFVLAGVYGRANYSRRESSGYDDELRGWGAGGQGAVGVEWFPTRHLSVGGHTGVRFGSDTSSGETVNPDGTRSDYTDSGGYFNTFTTALSVQMYF